MGLKTCLFRARLGDLYVPARCTSGGIYEYATHANGTTLKVVGLHEAHVWSVAAVTRSAHETSTGLEGRFRVGPFFVHKTLTFTVEVGNILMHTVSKCSGWTSPRMKLRVGIFYHLIPGWEKGCDRLSMEPFFPSSLFSLTVFHVQVFSTTVELLWCFHCFSRGISRYSMLFVSSFPWQRRLYPHTLKQFGTEPVHESGG